MKTNGITTPSPKRIAELVREEILNPVRPGSVDSGVPFWNGYSQWFVYAPAFAFPRVEGAAKYRFTVIGDDRVVRAFEADSPSAPLAPVWNELPRTGTVTVLCAGLDAAGRPIARCGDRTFWKASPFKTGFPPAARTYAESSRMALEWACKNVVSKWFDTDGHAVDKDSSVCYPSKMYSAGINGMLALAELCPNRADEYIHLARCCADRLIGISEPEGAPLAGFTPTYFKIEGLRMWCSTEYFGMNMLVYPACCGESFVALYQRVGDEKYLRAARLIAETYERIRLPNGTWHLKVWTKDGTPVKPNYLVPMEVISFMQRLAAVTGEEKWNDLAEGAIDYLRKGPLTDWNWEGQYEDVEPSDKYINLTMHGAGSYQLCLLARKNRDAATEATARELLRFMEDQFTCWEMPITTDNVIPLNKEMDFSPNQYARDTLAAWLLPGIDKHCLNPLIRDIGTRGTWALPCALEQYHCYRPVDGSSAKLIHCYTAMFETYGNPLDLLKAKALADTLTRVQEPDGRIMTFLRPGTEEADGLWPNCIIYSALALQRMATYQ